MKTALIVDGSSSAGVEIARGLYSLGWRVLIIAASHQDASKTVNELKKYSGGAVHPFSMDLSDLAIVHALAEQLADFVGSNCENRLDALIATDLSQCSLPLPANIQVPLLLVDTLAEPLCNAQGRVIFTGSARYRVFKSLTPQSLWERLEKKTNLSKYHCALAMNWLCAALSEQYPSLLFYAVDPTFTYHRQKHSLLNRYGISCGKASGTYICLCQAELPQQPFCYSDRKPFLPCKLATDINRAKAFLELCRAKSQNKAS